MFGLSRRHLCLDWDKRSLRMVAARVGSGGVALDDAHSNRIPAGTDIESAPSLGPFIAECLKRHRMRFKSCHIDVPRERAVINRLIVPPTPIGELPAAVRFQAMKELPFPLDEAQIDFAVMRRDERGMVTEVLLAAVRRDVLERLTATCSAAGLSVESVGLRPHSNLIGLTRIDELRESRVLFVEVGPATTEIDVFRDGVLAFSRSANVTVSTASSEWGEDSRVSAKGELAVVEFSQEAEDAAVNELLVEITRTLQAYRATESKSTIDRIVVAGASGIESELARLVEQRFGLTTELFDPTGPLRINLADAGKLRSFSAALGAAWSLSREGLREIDFLHPKRIVSTQDTLRRRVRSTAIAAGVVAAIGIGSAAYTYYQQHGRYAALSNEVSSLEKEARRLAELRNQTEEVDDWDKASLQSLWLDHTLAITQELVAPGKQSLVRGLTANERMGRISLELQCSEWTVARDFVTKLNLVRVNEKPVYEAKLGPWRETLGADAAFKGSVEVSVDILPLQDFYQAAPLRAKERKERLKI
ncbi:MAG: pilus assembly protein PilM [Phycisphaerae bacterium]